MTFKELLATVRSGTPVRSHSGQVHRGDVFVALPGAQADAGKYVPAAINSGAAYVVAEPGIELPGGAQAQLVVVEDVRAALGGLARAMYGSERAPKLVGVTGTNGKTTVAYLIERLLATAGKRVGVLGTISYRWPGYEEPAPLTTPDCLTVHKMLSAMRDAGTDVAVMEVSSHALDQGRVAGLDFDCAVLTNVTQDHLDYHGDMEGYFSAKAKLFNGLPRGNKVWVINAEDPYGRRLLDQRADAMAYGVDLDRKGRPTISGTILQSSAAGQTLEVSCCCEKFVLNTPLVGRHNAMNLLAAMGVGFAMGLKADDMQGLSGCVGAPGRLEPVSNDRGLNVFVDYAHTPDALENVLSAVRALDVKRVIAVFGCGGDRDRTKRPLMAQAVCRHADVAVLTSDNPRTEDPLAIIKDVRPGLRDCRQIIIEPDRRSAIAEALNMATPADAVVVAGKGHEDYQIVGTEKQPFSDAQVIREVLQCA